MASIEEKVKAFLSDEKKVEALESDSEFMEKVSGGTATPEDIVKKFSELGLELTYEEARAVSETTTAILTNPPISKLGNKSLDTVSGGNNWIDVASTAGFATGAAGAAGFLGCNIARIVCNYKAKNAALAGDTKLSHDYTDHATALGNVSKACASISATGFGMGVGLKLVDHSTVEKKSTLRSAEEPADTSASDNRKWQYNPLYEGND